MVHAWSGGRYCLTRMMQSNFNVHFKMAITATATKEKYKGLTFENKKDPENYGL